MSSVLKALADILKWVTLGVVDEVVNGKKKKKPAERTKRKIPTSKEDPFFPHDRRR